MFSVRLIFSAIVLSVQVPAAVLTVGLGGTCGGSPTTYDETEVQIAFDAAVAGDEVVLCAGQMFQTPARFRLDNDLTGWATIRSSRSAELPEGQRVFPADAAKLAKLCNTQSTDHVLDTKTTAKFWRLIGLEITRCASGQFSSNAGDLLMFGDSFSELRIDMLSHDFVVDRCYIHGNPYMPDARRGILALANKVTVINSYIGDINRHAGTEAHAFGSWLGNDFFLRNNYLSSSSENFITGGAQPVFPGATNSRQQIIGNHFHRPAIWDTHNFDADPEGTTLPDCLPASECIASQTFHDTDDDVFYMRTNVVPPMLEAIWVVINRSPANGPVCMEARTWRNVAADTLWTCNASGFWEAGGPNPQMYPQVSTDVAEGATTVITVANTGPQGSFGCAVAFPNGMACPTGAEGLRVNITGGTGDCIGINGRWRYSYVDTATNDGQVFSIPYPSTGQTCPNVTVIRDFLWWGNKNNFEWKQISGGVLEGNIIDGGFAHTWQQQRGAGTLRNWTAITNSSDSSFDDTLMANNIFKDIAYGSSEGNITSDLLVSSSGITPGTTTRFNTADIGAYNGSEVCISNGIDAWAGINRCWPISIAGTVCGSACQFTVPFNSSGLSDVGQTLRITSNLHFKPRAWPRNHRYYNNFWEIMDAPLLPGYAPYNSSTMNGPAYYTMSGGISFQVVYSDEIDHNTIVKPAFSPNWWPLTDLVPNTLPVHHATNSLGFPASVQVRRDMRITNNIFDGSGGVFAGPGSVEGFPDASTGITCAYGINMWNHGGGKAFMGGNLTSMAGVWHHVNPITEAGYGAATCPGWLRTWNRTGNSFPTTVSGSVIVSAGPVATFNWAAAARLLSGSRFCVTASTPSGLAGCYTVPAGVTETSVQWANVSVPGVATGTYTGVAVTSVVGFENYDNGSEDPLGYGLAAGSDMKGRALDGGDPGADIKVIKWSTEGVISGAPNPYLDSWITKVTPSDTSAEVCYSAYDSSTATLTIAATRSYTPDLGSDSVSQSGRNGCITVTGLTASTNYYARVHMAGGRYRDTYRNGRFAEFRTTEFATSSAAYLTAMDTDITKLLGSAAPVNVSFGCHLPFAQGNAFYGDYPGIYGSLTLWTAYVDNLAAAGCNRVAINVDLYDWIFNNYAGDAVGKQRYIDLFTYIRTTKGLQLEVNPQATARAKTAVQALTQACPSTNPCYSAPFDSPDDWFQGAKGAFSAIATLPVGSRPTRMIVVHEPTTINDRFLGVTGTAAQWNAVVNGFINDATHGITTLQPTIEAGAGCHRGEVSYCALFSDQAGVDIIGLDIYEASDIAISNSLAIAADAIAADGTPKLFYIEETGPAAYTNTGPGSEIGALHGVGWAPAHNMQIHERWLHAITARFSAAGATGVNLFWTQPLRYVALAGAADNGMSGNYNSLVGGVPATTLTPFGTYVR